MNLLEKTRFINSILQKSAGNPVDFESVATSLATVIEANVYIVSKDGKLLGYHIIRLVENERMEKMLVDEKFPDKYVERLMSVTQTLSNLPLTHELSAVPVENHDLFMDSLTTIVPIVGEANRIGTLVLQRLQGEFSDDDLVLGEYGATLVGIEILRAFNEEIERKSREKALVQVSIDSLSYSEQESIKHIFSELEGNDGLLVTSKIADRIGITRSVVVNALRKLESAGVLESRSLGMKGTHIRVLNKYLWNEVANINIHSNLM